MGARRIDAQKRRKRLELSRRVPLTFNVPARALVTGIAVFEGGPAGGIVMGGCMELIPPSPKFKPHAGFRRFNVLVYHSGFGVADGRDDLVAETDAVKDVPTLLRYWAPISFSGSSAVQALSEEINIWLSESVCVRCAR